VQTLTRIRPIVQPARRRLASLESLAPPAPIVAPFAVGIARPSRPARLRAPRGGATVAGRFYRGGSYLPAVATPAPEPVASVATSPAPADFVTWFFGPAFKARLDEIDAAREAEAEAEAGGASPARVRDGWADEHARELGPDPEDTTDHAEASGPSPRDEAFKLGYDLGLDREDARPPSDYPADLRGAFDEGWAAGKAEWDRRLEEMCGASEYAAWSSGRISDRDMWPAGCMS
jgi:hypothetical protein